MQVYKTREYLRPPQEEPNYVPVWVFNPTPQHWEKKQNSGQ